MKRICAYCQKEMAIVGTQHGTHGICARHFKNEMLQLMTAEQFEVYLAKKGKTDFCPDLSVLHGNE